MAFRTAGITALALLLAAPGLAQDIVRLSPAEREAALDAASSGLPINGAPGFGDGKPHGEMGVAVGSNGLRAVYGTTVIPLGDTGSLALGFSDAREHGRRPR